MRLEGAQSGDRFWCPGRGGMPGGRLTMDAAEPTLPAGVAQALAAAGMHGLPRRDDTATWEQALSALRYTPVTYSSASIDYQLAYQRGHGGDWSDISQILYHDGRPCGVWPLSLSVNEGAASITSHGLPVLPPMFVKGLPDASRKHLVKSCLRFVRELCCLRNIVTFESGESFADQWESGLSEWHEQSMNGGAGVACQHELFVDLSMRIEAIKARFRKSYKSLVVSGKRLWHTVVMAESNRPLWDEFRNLHFKVAGRVTRSSLSWDLQHQAIVDGHALLVHLRADDGRLVGGGFFSLTRDEGAYSVAAYDRSLFDKPLGHVVQFRAIEEMKRRGLRWYKLGRRPYPTDVPAPSEKEVSIGVFKQGFATHLFPMYVLRHNPMGAESA